MENRDVPSAANANFASALYDDVLRRPADSPGLTAWTAALDLGFSSGEVAYGFLTSTEYRTLTVNQDYEVLLHRPADSAGQSAGVSLLASGTSQNELLAMIAATPEYYANRGGGTDLGFLNALYSDAFGRPADPVVVSNAMPYLAAGGSRYQVALAVFNSPEFYSDLVESYYERFLRTTADASEISNGVNMFEAGASNEMVMANILGSPQFFSFAQTPPTPPPASHVVTVTAPADQTSTAEDTISGVTATATGGNGSPLSFTATGLPPGLSIDFTSGVISGTLTPASAGAYVVTVKANDGTESGTANFNWTVNANSAAITVTAPADQTNNAGATISGVTATATGGNGSALTFSATNLPPGLTINPSSGAITGTLTASSAGAYAVTVDATDGTETGSANFNWTVNANAITVTAPADQTNNAEDTVSGVTVTATGGNGSALTFSATNLPPGLTINPSSGAITGTLTASSAGAYAVTVDATDGTETGSANFNWTVNANADAITVTAPADQANNAEDTVSGVTVTATGGNGSALTFSATNLPPGLTIDPSSGAITGTLTASSAGAYAVTVKATDGTETGSANFNWTVNANTEAITVTAPTDQTSNAGDVVSGVTVTATGGNGSALTFSATNLPPGLTIDPSSGAITGTVTLGTSGAFAVTVNASDGTETGSANFQWTVNNPNAVTVTAPADQTNNAGDTVTGVSVTATGGNGAALTFSATNLPPGLTIDPSSGVISGTLTPGSAGAYAVTVNATDGTETGSANFNWTVNTNAITVTAPADQTNNAEDTVSGVTVTATGGNGAALTFSATNLPPGLTIDPNSGAISGTLTPGSAGAYAVTVTATDGAESGSANFNWTVNANAITVTAPADQTNNAEDTVSGVTVTATGGNGGALTFSAANLPPGLTIDPTSGVISGTLTPGSAGAYAVTVNATDGTETGSANFNWTVNTNADAITVTAPADQTKNAEETVSGVTVTASGGNGGALTFSAKNLPPGLTIDPSSGVISGTLTPGSAGAYAVTVNATDSTETGSANFNWTVNANADAITVTAPADQTNNEGDVVSGITATASGGNGAALTFSATNLPPGLSIDPNSGVISGTLTPTSAGTYIVIVNATDGAETGSANFQWVVMA